MKIQLKTSCISNVPFQSYINDFSFVVNGEEFKTSRIISDILSPKISKTHLNDPTFETFTINTHNTGNFLNVLNLINFSENDIPINEFPFIREVIDILENKSINIKDPTKTVKITIDNVFSLILEHEKYDQVYSKRIEQEIDLSQHIFMNYVSHVKKNLKAFRFKLLKRLLIIQISNSFQKTNS